MGRIVGKFINGLVNNLVFREYRGVQIVQAKPFTPKKHRTKGTVNAATVFGKASSLAREIRNGLYDAYGKYYDGTMIFRLNAEILRCLNLAKDNATQEFTFNADSFQKLAGFEFNTNSPLKQHFLVQPIITVNGNILQVTIPEMEVPDKLKFPDRSDCRLVVLTTMINLVNGKLSPFAAKLMDIPYTYQTKTIPARTFEFETQPGCLCITALSLNYIEKTFAGDIIVNNKSFSPAAILNAYITEGEVVPELQRVGGRLILRQGEMRSYGGEEIGCW